MTLYFADTLKALRAARGVSQETLAKYLGVSPQAVSKWENACTYPDITLLPLLARYFSVSIDTLLAVEKIDEEKLYADYDRRAAALFDAGKLTEVLAVWQEGYHALPNHPRVQEKLMSSYFDVDPIRYREEILDLGMTLYNAGYESTEDGAYLRGQALELSARTYAAAGERARAEAWATKANYLLHAQEFLMTEITSGRDRLSYFRFANLWYFRRLCQMTCRVAEDPALSDLIDREPLYDTVISLLEAAAPILLDAQEAHAHLRDLLARVASCAAARGDLDKAARARAKSAALPPDISAPL